jgi:tetratricopeptide (TPR) repeat protein
VGIIAQPQNTADYKKLGAPRLAFLVGSGVVDSMVNNAGWRELSRAAANWPTGEELGLTPAEFKIYTEYGDDERIRDYALEITQGMDRYSDKVLMIYDRLKYGEYRYSLKPGIAPDGDQLGWFLFNTKKGYCSYYAFAMSLMLRSLGIPARVAAGFFIDPEVNTFNYYPVRSDMAHAWVEVLFPGYGWIEFDPTAEDLAEGEEFRFSSGVDPNLFERLMREILENRWLLRAKEGRELSSASPVSSLMRITAALLKKFWLIPLLVIAVILSVTIRCAYFIASALHTDNRKKAVRLWKHCRRRLRLAGVRQAPSAHESEWAHNADTLIPGVYSLYQSAAAARFAPEYTADDFIVMRANYRTFSDAYRRTVSLPRRVIAWALPLLALLLPVWGKTGSTDLKKKRRVTSASRALPLVLLVIFLAGSDTNAQTSDSVADADTLFWTARTAIFSENWEHAIENLKIGERYYPDDIRFPWALGNLYYDRSLYGLAWDEFKKGETIDRFDEDIVVMLARTAGFLNKSHTSIEYYQIALQLNPENRDTISNLGWMFYKVHRLSEGEKIMTDAIDRFGEDADFAMTLGTIYSAMYNYEKSKYWYQRAIALGREIGDMSFTAVAHYNLSILESRFYHYDLSMNETNASLTARRRASGMLARGELNMRRLELRQSQLDYQDAYEMDTSPLAKLSLAQIYQISGRLDEARLYAEDCLRATDHSWMLNYGIDPDRHKRDIHEILYNTYEGLSRTEPLTPWAKPGEKVRSLFRRIVYRYKTAVHLRLYEKYSLAAADSFRAELSSESPLLDTTLQYFNSFRRYRRGRIYLDCARELETRIIPAANPSYDLEEGIQDKNTHLLEQAIAGLNPQWERLSIAECYRHIADMPRKPLSMNDGTNRPESKTQRAEKQRLAAEELFALNRGGLRQAGLSLPTEVTVIFGSETFPGTRGTERLLRKTLGKTGFRIAHNEAGKNSRYKLQLNIEGSPEQGYSVLYELTDTLGAGQIIRRSLPLRDLSRPAIFECARRLGSAVFVVE